MGSVSPSLDGETMETVTDFILGGSKITADGDCSHEIKRCLLLGSKAMTNLDSILKSRDITLATKVRLVKAVVFPVIMYGCESWTIKKAQLSSVQISSITQSCLTLCDPMDCSMPGLPVHHQLPEFTQTHVHQVGDAITSWQIDGETMETVAAFIFLGSQITADGGDCCCCC